MIPFNVPPYIGAEDQYVSQAIHSHKICGDGSFTKRCSDWLERRFRAKKVLLTTSGSDALEMAALLCELSPGDEVILPSYTFSSTANAFALFGAKLVFVDIRPDTMNIDEKRIEDAITERTKVIVPVHYAGVSCEMDTIIMGDYSLGRGYVHSDSLKWSYGDYKGKDSDLWNRSLSELNISEQVKRIAVIGFEGIYIDTYAYTQEELAALTGQIEAVIGTGDIHFASDNGRLLFYGLHSYQDKLNSLYSEENLSNMRVQYLITCVYGNGFYGLEGTAEGNWRWCDQVGILSVKNPTEEDMTVQLSAVAYTGYEELSTLEVALGDAVSEYQVSAAGAEVEFTFTAHPGENQIYFSTDAQRVDAPADPRSMYFRLQDASAEVIS